MRRFLPPLLALVIICGGLLIMRAQSQARDYTRHDGSAQACTLPLADHPTMPNDPTYGAPLVCIEGYAPNAWNLSHPCYIDGGGAYGAFYDKSGKFIGNGRLKCHEYAPDMPAATDNGSIFSRTPGPEASPSALGGPLGASALLMGIFVPTRRRKAPRAGAGRAKRALKVAGLALAAVLFALLVMLAVGLDHDPQRPARVPHCSFLACTPAR